MDLSKRTGWLLPRTVVTLLAVLGVAACTEAQSRARGLGSRSRLPAPRGAAKRDHKPRQAGTRTHDHHIAALMTGGVRYPRTLIRPPSRPCAWLRSDRSPRSRHRMSAWSKRGAPCSRARVRARRCRPIAARGRRFLQHAAAPSRAGCATRRPSPRPRCAP